MKEVLQSHDFAALEVKLAAAAVSPDPYKKFAADALGVPLAEITPEQRRISKQAFFGRAYGGSDHQFIRSLRNIGVQL